MKRTFIRIGVGILMLVLVIFATLFAVRYSARELAWVEFEDKLLFFTIDGEVGSVPYDANKYGVGRYYIYTSMDMHYAAFIADPISRDGSTLYRVDSFGTTAVAENVKHALLSDDGDKLAYIQINEDHTGSLYLYDHSSRKHTLLEKKVYAPLNDHRLSISPDGRTVAYCREEGESSVDMVWNRGKYHELGEGAFAVAVANNMDPLYYALPKTKDLINRVSYDYYVRSGDKDTLILNDNTRRTFLFNRDYTESYIDYIFTDNRGDVHKVDYNFLSFAELGIEQQFISHLALHSGSYVTRFSANSFAETNAYVEKGTMDVAWAVNGYPARVVGYIGDDYSFSPKIRANNLYQVVEEGASVLTLNDPFVRISSDEKTGGEIFVRGVRDFVAADDMSGIYYVDMDRNLCYKQLEPEAEAVILVENAVLSRGGNLNYYIYYSEEKLPIIDGVLYFLADDTQSLCAARNGETETIFVADEERHGYIRLYRLDDRIIARHQYLGDDGWAADYYVVTQKKLKLILNIECGLYAESDIYSMS